MGKGRKMVQMKKPKGAGNMPDMSALNDMMGGMGGMMPGMSGMPGLGGAGGSGGGMPDLASLMQGLGGMGGMPGGMPGSGGGDGQMPDMNSMMNMMKSMGMDPSAMMGGGAPGGSGSGSSQGGDGGGPFGGMDPMALAALMPPPKPDKDKKYGHVNAGDFSRWVMVYPIYLNASKTLAEGRRVPKNIGCISPTVEDLAEACNLLRLKYIVEPNKQYPREWNSSGRIRVEIKHPETGSKLHREILTRKDLYEKLALKIPLLSGRKSRLENEKLREERRKRMEEEQAKKKIIDQKNKSTSGSTSTSNGGKGRKENKVREKKGKC